MVNATFRGMKAGEQLGNLEYLVDDRVVAEYQALVGNCASYANLIADDCASMTLARFGDIGLTTVWRRFDFLRPPISGRRIQVGGWLKEVRERAGLPWLRVSAFAVDEIGTEILRSEAAFAIGVAKVPPEQVESILRNTPNNGEERSFNGHVGDSLPLGEWVVPSGQRFRAYEELRCELTGIAKPTDGHGDTQLLAGWLEGQFSQRLGDDFRWGGRLVLAYRTPATPGVHLVTDAVVMRCDKDHRGTRSVTLTIDVRNERKKTVAVGEASANMPSPRLL
ncbi:MAG: hypothetical protein F4X64_17120 [Chloroflexi bacterium]|nr:hypothetical protein [Chloroflexota bacterium]